MHKKLLRFLFLALCCITSVTLRPSNENLDPIDKIQKNLKRLEELRRKILSYDVYHKPSATEQNQIDEDNRQEQKRVADNEAKIAKQSADEAVQHAQQKKDIDNNLKEIKSQLDVLQQLSNIDPIVQDACSTVNTINDITKMLAKADHLKGAQYGVKTSKEILDIGVSIAEDALNQANAQNKKVSQSLPKTTTQQQTKQQEKKPAQQNQTPATKQEQEKINSGRNSYIRDHLSVDQFYIDSVKQYNQALQDGDLDRAQRCKERLEALKETLETAGKEFDYSLQVDNQKFNDEFAYLFNNRNGTALDRQLHKELCNVKIANIGVQAHNPNDIFTDTLGQSVDIYAAIGKVDKNIARSFDVVEYANELVDYEANCAQLFQQGQLKSLVDSRGVFEKGATAVCKAGYTLVKDTINPMTYVNGVANVMTLAGVLAFVESDAGLQADILDCQLESGFTNRELEDVLEKGTQRMNQRVAAVKEYANESIESIKKMPWDKLLENAIVVGGEWVRTAGVLGVLSKFDKISKAVSLNEASAIAMKSFLQGAAQPFNSVANVANKTKAAVNTAVQATGGAVDDIINIVKDLVGNGAVTEAEACELLTDIGITVKVVAEDGVAAAEEFASFKKVDRVVESGTQAAKGFAETFEKKISKMPVNERVAAIKTEAGNIANSKGWVEAPDKISRLNRGRDIYMDESTRKLYSVDTQHGRFEVLNEKGKHLGEVDFDFNLTKGPDFSGGHDLKVR